MARQKTTRSVGRTSADKQLAHYLDVLGLKPGAKPDEIAMAYFAIKKALTEKRSTKAEALGAKVDHAFRILKARYRQQPREALRRQINRFLIAATAALAVLSLLSLFQLSDKLRPYFVSFNGGDRVIRADNGQFFGTILFSEDDHEFPDGSRNDAYRVRVESTKREIWLTARTATKVLREE